MSRQVIYVGGKRFTVITDESEAYMKKITEKLDTRLKSISSSNPQLDRDSVAILASLDYCDEEHKIREQLNNVKSQIKDYLDDVNRLHREIAELKEKNIELQSKIKTLKKVPEKKDNKKKKTDNNEKVVVAAGKVENNAPTVMDGAVQQSLFE